jgi:hypothetical protein
MKVPEYHFYQQCEIARKARSTFVDLHFHSRRKVTSSGWKEWWKHQAKNFHHFGCEEYLSAFITFALTLLQIKQNLHKVRWNLSIKKMQNVRPFFYPKQSYLPDKRKARWLSGLKGCTGLPKCFFIYSLKNATMSGSTLRRLHPKCCCRYQHYLDWWAKVLKI